MSKISLGRMNFIGIDNFKAMRLVADATISPVGDCLEDSSDALLKDA